MHGLIESCGAVPVNIAQQIEYGCVKRQPPVGSPKNTKGP
jgi:hypothetical protein